MADVPFMLDTASNEKKSARGGNRAAFYIDPTQITEPVLFERIKAEQFLSLHDFARHASISSSTLSRGLRGIRPFTRKSLIKIESALNKNKGDLV